MYYTIAHTSMGGGGKQRLALVKFPFTFISRTTPSPLAGLDAPIIGAPS